MIITGLRRALSAAWAVTVIALIGLAAWSNLASLVVVAGDSMEPAVQHGALIGPAEVDIANIAVGEILTVRADNGVILTHRVVRVVDLPEGRFFELQGDANPSPDPELVPARAVMGRVDLQIPYAGYVLAFLTIPIGLVFLLATLGMLLVVIWLLEDMEAGTRRTVRANSTAKATRGASA